MYNLSCPALLSMFHQFHYLYYLSVLSNAQNQNCSKGSLPNVQGVFNCYLLQLCPLSQPAVLCPSTRPSANVFTSLKMASLAGIFRISGSLAKDHVDCFTSGHHHHESVVSVFLNIFNCVYAIWNIVIYSTTCQFHVLVCWVLVCRRVFFFNMISRLDAEIK